MRSIPRRGGGRCRYRLTAGLALAAAAAMSLAACSSGSGSSAPASSAAANKAPTPVTAVLNWLPEGELSPLYQASAAGIDTANGIKLKIIPGGPKVQAASTVGSGSAEFGIENAQNLVIARSKGVPVVGLAETFDQYPQCLIYHADDPVNSIEDLKGRTVAVSQGSGEWQYMVKRYGLQDVKTVPYSGSMASFEHDDSLVQQCNVSDEPYIAQQQGIKYGVFDFSSTGFNPYGNVLFTTESMIKKNPQLVSEVTKTFVEGLDGVLKDPTPAINAILKVAPDSDRGLVKFAIATLAKRVATPPGSMTASRWETLYNQMHETGVITTSFDWHTLYTNQFFPKGNG